MFMAIMRKLVTLLSSETYENLILAAKWEKKLAKKLHIKLPTAEKKKTFTKHLNKARLGRPDYLHILKSRELLLGQLDKLGSAVDQGKSI